MTIEMEYKTYKELKNLACGIGIFRNDGVQCYGTNTEIDHIRDLKLTPKGKVIFQVESNWLLPGEYSLDVAIHTEDGFAYDYYRYAKTFAMYSNVPDAGVSRIVHH